MYKLFGLKFRNYQLAFKVLKDLGHPTDGIIYIGSTKLRDFFQDRATHEIFKVYQKGCTGYSATLSPTGGRRNK